MLSFRPALTSRALPTLPPEHPPPGPASLPRRFPISFQQTSSRKGCRQDTAPSGCGNGTGGALPPATGTGCGWRCFSVCLFILFDWEYIIFSRSRANLAGRARSTYIHVFVKSVPLGAYMHLIIIIIRFPGIRRAKEGEEGKRDRDAELSRRR